MMPVNGARSENTAQTIGTADNTYRDQRKSYLLSWLATATNDRNLKELSAECTGIRVREKDPEMRRWKLEDEQEFLYPALLELCSH